MFFSIFFLGFISLFNLFQNNRVYWELLENSNFESLAFILSEKENKLNLLNKNSESDLITDTTKFDNTDFLNDKYINFLIGYLFFISKQHTLAIEFFQKEKNSDMIDFATYFSGMSAFYNKEFSLAEDFFLKTSDNHYFYGAKYYYLAACAYRLRNIDALEEIIREKIHPLRTKERKEILENYLQLVTTPKYRKKYKENIKKTILKLLEDDPFYKESPLLKGYVQKFFDSYEVEFIETKSALNSYLKKYKYKEGLEYLSQKISYFETNRDTFNKLHKKSDSLKKSKADKSSEKTDYFDFKITEYKDYYDTIFLYKIKYYFYLRKYRDADKFISSTNKKHHIWKLRVLQKLGKLEEYKQFKKTKKIDSEESRYMELSMYFVYRKEKEYEESLDSFLTDYPNSSYRWELIEKTAWHFYRKGDWNLSLKYYQIMLESKSEYRKEMALYWMGKIYYYIGEERLFLEFWSKIINKYPLSYYSNMILNQPFFSQKIVLTHHTKDTNFYKKLDENILSDFDLNYEKLLESKDIISDSKIKIESENIQLNNILKKIQNKNLEINNISENNQNKNSEFNNLSENTQNDYFKIYNDNIVPDYIKFFVKYKFYNLAKYELFYIYKKQTNTITDKMKMLLAKLYKIENNDIYAHWILHKGLKDISYPSQNNYDYWKISFPTPFEKEVKDSLIKFSIPEPLVYSIIRQESAFNPNAQSFSNAYGLMQLLYSTAIIVRKFTDVKLYSSWSLYNPEVNIPLGVAYLQNLMELFSNNIIYASASYNAGEKRIERWVKEFGYLPPDEFIENIPINQTRDYVKKVLTGYIAYEYLYQNQSLYFTPIKGIKESKSFFYKEKK